MITEAQAIEHLRQGKKPTAEVIGRVVKPVLTKLCVATTYAYGQIIKHPTKKREYQIEEDETNDPNEIAVITGNTKELQHAGVHEKYGGWSYQEKRGKLTRREIFINNEMKPESQILTLAHETGHHVLKNAVSYKVEKRVAEKKAMAFERVFRDEFNKRHKGKLKLEYADNRHNTQASGMERKIVQTNIKPIFLKKSCALNQRKK